MILTTDNQNDHSVFILSPPETLNTCNKIVLFDSFDTASFGNVSLHNIDAIYSYIVLNKLCYTIYKEDDLYKYPGNRRNGKGFNTIICISDSGEILGYVKYFELQNIKDRAVNIKIEVNPEVSEEAAGVLDISYSVDGLVLDKDEKDKYKDYLNTEEAREIVKEDNNHYTTHLSACGNIFLGDLSVVSDKAVKLDVMYGEKLCPYPDTSFDNYSIGYVAGGDLALYSWSDNTYSVTSLQGKDIYGNPKSYIATKEGRAFSPVYKKRGITRNTTINYISGRYISCTVADLGIRLYDTYLGEWLDGEYLISDPYSEINKIYGLSSDRVLYSELAKLIPAVSRAYILEKEKKRILQPYRVIGNWIIFREEGSNSEKMLVCGSTFRLHIKASELNKLMILNDYTLILKESDYIYYIYTGTFKTFSTPEYLSSWSNSLPEDEKGIGEMFTISRNILESPLRFYKRRPGTPEMKAILTTFAGLIFYKDSENRLYYL